MAHELWERSPDPRFRHQVLLFNLTTVLTVVILFLYLKLFVLVVAGSQPRDRAAAEE